MYRNIVPPLKRILFILQSVHTTTVMKSYSYWLRGRCICGFGNRAAETMQKPRATRLCGKSRLPRRFASRPKEITRPPPPFSRGLSYPPPRPLVETILASLSLSLSFSLFFRRSRLARGGCARNGRALHARCKCDVIIPRVVSWSPGRGVKRAPEASAARRVPKGLKLLKSGGRVAWRDRAGVRL